MTVIADTGALFALMDVDDAWHHRVLAWWSRNLQPVIVPVTVLPEATYLLQTRISPAAEIAFVRAIGDEEFAIEHVDPDDIDRAASIMAKYDDFPLGFVDASIVALAERLEVREILTTDRRHFNAIRPAHARSFTLVP
ncbi:MAG TPA: PIN domain-containing protein [Gemmatimonadaceae bacterium]|nr:PIN domain-containing protein [Gemmatimonadaceae bacterium]